MTRVFSALTSFLNVGTVKFVLMSQFSHVFVDKDEGLSSSGDDQGRGLPALPQTFVDNDGP